MKLHSIAIHLLISIVAIFLISFQRDRKKVLIIGDSISIGYTPFVKTALAGTADVMHNPGNAQHTGTGLRNIDKWLGNTKWDVIHFNWGLWDLAYRNPESKEQGNRDKIKGKITFTPAQYAANLDTLVRKLKATGAKLIFATTTVVPANEAGRNEGDDKKYNDVALFVMKKYGVEINDLHNYSSGIHSKYAKGNGDVHYTEEGYRQFAEHVTEAIKKALLLPGGNLTNYGKQAWEESTIPIRPGVPGKTPFWNKRVRQFIYAPAFDYKTIAGATKYRYTITPESTNKPLRFESKVQYDPLSKIWKSVPVGLFTIKVEGLDANGKVIGVSGEGKYHRAAPFNGIYHEPQLPYRQSATVALDSLLNKPFVKYWFKEKQPDWEYLNNRYPAKIQTALLIGALTNAKLKTGIESEESGQLAKIIGDYLLSIRFAKGTPWEYFVPTYYGPKVGRKEGAHINLDNMFTLMGVDAGRAFLDLYDYTKDKKYLDAALKIADTYLKNQLSNGSWHQFVYHETGKPFFNNILIPTAVVNYFDRLKHDYKITKYDVARQKAFNWTMNNPVKTFDWQGQFEDVKGQQPYMNLSREQACELAMYLFRNKQHIPLAEELVRFAEDQFVIWDNPPKGLQFRTDREGGKSETWITPSVQEQYVFWMPVGRAAAIMLDTYAKAYTATGKDIYLAKARSIANSFTVVQKLHNGNYQTMFSKYWVSDWLNSIVYSSKTMMEFDELQKNKY